jgi:hypothetical protein
MKINIDDAVEFFNTHGYLVINSARASGKTTTLQRIIEVNSHLKIGVKCPTLRAFDWGYKKYKNCTFLNEYAIKEYYDIIIGDEVFITPRSNLKTACAYTAKYVTCTLNTSIPHLNSIRKDSPPNKFEIEFGQYLE